MRDTTRGGDLIVRHLEVLFIAPFMRRPFESTMELDLNLEGEGFLCKTEFGEFCVTDCFTINPPTDGLTVACISVTDKH